MAGDLARRFAWLEAVQDDTQLDAYSKAVASAMFRHMDSGLSCFPSTATLARESSCTRDTVICRVRALVSAGYLQVDPSKGGRRADGRGASNRYVGVIPAPEVSTGSTVPSVDRIDSYRPQVSTPAPSSVDPSAPKCRPDRHEHSHEPVVEPDSSSSSMELASEPVDDEDDLRSRLAAAKLRHQLRHGQQISNQTRWLTVARRNLQAGGDYHDEFVAVVSLIQEGVEPSMAIWRVLNGQIAREPF